MNNKSNLLKIFQKYKNIAHEKSEYIEINFSYIFRTFKKPVFKGRKIKLV